MSRRCSVCSRPDAGAIAALLAEGRSVLGVARELGVSEDALQRHAARHLPPRRAAARPAPPRDPTGGDPLDELVAALREQALAGHPAIVHQYRLALAAQADGRHQAPPRRALEDEPEWRALRERLLAALSPHPEALAAVLDALGAS